MSNFLRKMKTLGTVSALINGRRLTVSIKQTSFGHFASCTFDGQTRTQWARSASNAVAKLCRELQQDQEVQPCLN